MENNMENSEDQIMDEARDTSGSMVPIIIVILLIIVGGLYVFFFAGQNTEQNLEEDPTSENTSENEILIEGIDEELDALEAELNSIDEASLE